jgi:hypothetical protein
VKLRCYSFGCGFFGCRDVAATFLLRQHGFGWLYAVSDINRSRGSGPVILPLEGVIDLASAIHAPVLSARRAAAESPTVFGFAVRRHFVAAATTSTEKTVDQWTGHPGRRRCQNALPTTAQRAKCFQNAEVTPLASDTGAQLVMSATVMPRYSAITSVDNCRETLTSSMTACFLTAIELRSTSLKWFRSRPLAKPACRYDGDQLFSDFFQNHVQRDRHRWLFD